MIFKCFILYPCIPAASVPTPKKRNELNFDDDGDDLMDALGFSDAPKRGERGSGLVPKKERNRLIFFI